MFPPFPVNNAAYIRLASSMFAGNAFLGASRCPDIHNFSVGKFGSGAIYTPIVPISSMLGSVKHVFTMSPPAKILKKTMGWTPIKMTALHAWRTGAGKSKQNQAMNRKSRMFSISGKGYFGVSVGSQAMLEDFIRFAQNTITSAAVTKPFSLPIRSYRAMVTDLVSRPSWNWFKMLRGYGKILVSHGVALLHRVASGLEPYRCDNSGAACFLYNKII